MPNLASYPHKLCLPPIDTLLVVNLDGSYGGEILRLRGALCNVGSWSEHAAPL